MRHVPAQRGTDAGCVASKRPRLFGGAAPVRDMRPSLSIQTAILDQADA